MNNLRELEISEMVEISGGVNPAYELGYAIGTALRRVILIYEVYTIFK
jgi:hypothetical protein